MCMCIYIYIFYVTNDLRPRLGGSLTGFDTCPTWTRSNGDIISIRNCFKWCSKSSQQDMVDLLHISPSTSRKKNSTGKSIDWFWRLKIRFFLGSSDQLPFLAAKHRIEIGTWKTQFFLDEKLTAATAGDGQGIGSLGTWQLGIFPLPSMDWLRENRSHFYQALDHQDQNTGFSEVNFSHRPSLWLLEVLGREQKPCQIYRIYI